MKIDYDSEADALYIRFQPGNVKQSIQIKEGIVLDMAEDGSLFGIEILDATRRIPASELTHINVNLPLKKAS